MTRFENVGVFIREKVWLENSQPIVTCVTLTSSFLLAQVIFKPNLYPYKYSNILKPSHSSYQSAYEDGTDSVPKRRHIKFRRRGITQKKEHSIQNTAKV